MKPKDIYQLLSDLSEVLHTIAISTDDFETADRLHELASDIEEKITEILSKVDISTS